MPERSSYAAGTPCWVDVSSPDLDGTVDFYTGLFGWEAVRLSDAAAGGHTTFRQEGADVAAAGPLRDGAAPAWTTYIASDDAAATAARVGAAGGVVLAEPFEVRDAGVAALARDPTGACFGIWQARRHPGAGLVNEPNTFSWSELWTPDPVRAAAFYAAVFGWETEVWGEAPDAPLHYRVEKVDGASVAGIAQADRSSGGASPGWTTYFAVADADTTAAQAAKLGGTVAVEPRDTEFGRFALLADPFGAVFAIIALAAQ